MPDIFKVAIMKYKTINDRIWTEIASWLTFDILFLLSPVKNAKLLISFWITKFCSSLLKFWKKHIDFWAFMEKV